MYKEISLEKYFKYKNQRTSYLLCGLHSVIQRLKLSFEIKNGKTLQIFKISVRVLLGLFTNITC